MKQKILGVAAGIAMAAVSAQAAICTFDSLPYDDGGLYWNGSDGSGMFVNGDAVFMNNYNTTYGSWDGFAYSKVNDTTTEGLGSQFASSTGTDRSGGGSYAVGFVGYMSSPTLSLGAVTGEDYNTTLKGAYFANTTYAALSMRNGDDYAKKFGGETGDDADWFKLTIKGLTEEGGYSAENVEFYLADYRYADNDLDYIVDEWTWVDLGALGNVVGLEFELASSDNGLYGMNTPAYFAMDDMNVIPEPSTVVLMAMSAVGLVGARRLRG